jgi:hypothetical protein
LESHAKFEAHLPANLPLANAVAVFVRMSAGDYDAKLKTLAEAVTCFDGATLASKVRLVQGDLHEALIDFFNGAPTAQTFSKGGSCAVSFSSAGREGRPVQIPRRFAPIGGGISVRFVAEATTDLRLALSEVMHSFDPDEDLKSFGFYHNSYGRSVEFQIGVDNNTFSRVRAWRNGKGTVLVESRAPEAAVAMIKVGGGMEGVRMRYWVSVDFDRGIVAMGRGEGKCLCGATVKRREALEEFRSCSYVGFSSWMGLRAFELVEVGGAVRPCAKCALPTPPTSP